MLFAVAMIATFSIDGLITVAATLPVLGVLRPGPLLAKLGPCAIAVAMVLVFFATPLGAKRIGGETATSLTAVERGEATSTLDTRLYRWKTLLPEWERSPVLGQGLGVTTTAVNTVADPRNSLLPHNEYIRYLVETGVLGLAIMLAALLLLARDLARKRSIPGVLEAGTVNAPALALAVLAGCLVNSLANNTLLSSPTGYAVALIVIAVLALPGIPSSSPRAPRPQTT
jgi:O-antigen ligase